MNIQSPLKRCSWVAAFIVVVFAGGCSTTPVRENPDFAKAALKVDKVVILPPEVTVTKIVFAGDNERLLEEENSVGQLLNGGVPGILKEHGYTVRDFSQDKLQSVGQDINFTLQQIRSAYQQASRQLYEKANVSEDQSRNFRVSVGPVVNPIAEAMDADALLIVDYAGYKKSGGLMAKEVVSGALFAVLTGVVPVPSSTGGGMEMALVDATTGDVLWANRGGGAFDALTLARQLLAKLPSKDNAKAPAVAHSVE